MKPADVSDLQGIPQSLWDTPMDSLDGQTPRQAAQHIKQSGCRACWFNLADLRKEHQS